MFLALLAAVLVLTVGWWAFVGGGLISLTNFGAVLSSRGLAGFGAETTPNGAAPAATTGVVAYDVNLALQRLTEASPEIPPAPQQRVATPALGHQRDGDLHLGVREQVDSELGERRPHLDHARFEWAATVGVTWRAGALPAGDCIRRARATSLA